MSNIIIFGKDCRRRSQNDVNPLLLHGLQGRLRGFPGLLGSLDDSHEDDQSVTMYRTVAANQSEPSSSSRSRSRRRQTPHNCVQVGNTSITLLSGNLAEQDVDVIINSAAGDLDLKKGAGSCALLNSGGVEIQQECHEKYPYGLPTNQVAVTSAGTLKCKKLYHVTLPQWNGSNEKEIEQAFTNCLALAEQYKVNSVAVPPLGIGYLGYPDDVIARTMITAMVEFDKCQMTQHMRSVFVVCHRSQNPVFKALETEMKQLTVQLHMDMYKEDIKSPTYWTHYNGDKSLREWNCHLLSANRCWELVTVSPEEHSAIEKLVYSTWMKQYVGQGRDAKGLDVLRYSNIQVEGVERIENPSLAEKYCQCRATMFHKVGQLQRTFPKLEDIPYTKRGAILTTEKTDKTLTREMYPMVNEHYLFHGTTPDRIEVIAAQGFDNRLTKNAMFGPGVYTAESPTKCDQYSDPKDQRDKRTPKKMILTRVLLGEMYVTDEVTAFQRPPCKTCRKDKCCNSSHNARGQGFFDSVIIDGQWNFREFVVYNSSQCYPEYIITYKRI